MMIHPRRIGGLPGPWMLNLVLIGFVLLGGTVPLQAQETGPPLVIEEWTVPYPGSFELVGYDLPEGSRPRRLVIDSRDRIWYVDYRRGKIGLVVEGDGFQEEFDLPGGEQSRPYGMAIDRDDVVWAVETGLSPNRFVGFDTKTERFVGTAEVGSGGGTIRHMYYDGRTNSIWFGTDVNTVGYGRSFSPGHSVRVCRAADGERATGADDAVAPPPHLVVELESPTEPY